MPESEGKKLITKDEAITSFVDALNKITEFSEFKEKFEKGFTYDQAVYTQRESPVPGSIAGSYTTGYVEEFSHNQNVTDKLNNANFDAMTQLTLHALKEKQTKIFKFLFSQCDCVAACADYLKKNPSFDNEEIKKIVTLKVAEKENKTFIEQFSNPLEKSLAAALVQKPEFTRDESARNRIIQATKQCKGDLDNYFKNATDRAKQPLVDVAKKNLLVAKYKVLETSEKLKKSDNTWDKLDVLAAKLNYQKEVYTARKGKKEHFFWNFGKSATDKLADTNQMIAIVGKLKSGADVSSEMSKLGEAATKDKNSTLTKLYNELLVLKDTVKSVSSSSPTMK